jgi:hypothetical protein
MRQAHGMYVQLSLCLGGANFNVTDLLSVSEEGKGEIQLTAEDYLQGVIGMVNELVCKPSSRCLICEADMYNSASTICQLSHRSELRVANPYRWIRQRYLCLVLPRELCPDHS